MTDDNSLVQRLGPAFGAFYVGAGRCACSWRCIVAGALAIFVGRANVSSRIP